MENITEILRHGAGNNLDDAALRLCLGWDRREGEWFSREGKVARIKHRIPRPSQKLEDAYLLASEVARRTKGVLRTTTTRAKSFAYWSSLKLGERDREFLNQSHQNPAVAITRACIAFACYMTAELYQEVVDSEAPGDDESGRQ